MVAQSCRAVIACRARKDQKAKLTRLVRKGNHEVVTLAIGDGANDVEMIRTAHIGVGVIGKEGTQAVNNADYAIGQFRFLTRLILVYGHRNYRGITLASLLIFYKNILFTLIQYLYTFICGFSGMRNQSFIAIMLYNTAFTAFGPFFIAVFDRDLSDANCIRFPQIHRQGIEHQFFSVKLFVIVFVKALWEGVVIGYMIYYCCVSADYGGGTIEVYLYGMVTVTATILVANLSASLLQSSSSVISVTGFWFFFSLWLIGVALISQLRTLMPYYYKYINALLGTPVTYFIVLISVIVAILPSAVMKAISFNTRPILTEIVQSMQEQHEDTTVLKEALEERERKRTLEKGLSTLKALPNEAKMPQLMTNSAIGDEVMKEDGSPTSDVSSQIVHPMNVQMSIRSIAGVRALRVCEQIHGPYEQMSVNVEAQNTLIEMINSHDWRIGKKHGHINVF